jgi:hypothetical protein
VGAASAAGLFVLLAGLMVGALVWLGPDIARDWRVGRDLVPARDAKLEEARCGTRVFVIKACEVRYDDPVRGAGAFWYMFLGRGEETGVVLLSARGRPELLTSDLGQAKLWGRTLMLLGVLALLAWCIVLSARVVGQGAVTRRALATLDGHRLRTVVVAVQDNFTVAHKRRRWTYLYGEAGREERAIIELPSSDEPLFVTPDRRYALALAGPAGGAPLLLEMHLKALDLSETEKEAFYAACRKVLGVEEGSGSGAEAG